MTIKRPSHSPDDTFRIGVALGRQLKGNELVLLKGELGAGKTLLTKGIASALGIEPREIVSPTFTLVNEFRLSGSGDYQEDLHFLHIDLYRLGPSITGGLPEIDDNLHEAVIVVEWAQFLNPAYFKLTHSIEITLHLEKNEDNSRTLEINTSLDYITI